MDAIGSDDAGRTRRRSPEMLDTRSVFISSCLDGFESRFE
jgi:hypothetical protein